MPRRLRENPRTRDFRAIPELSRFARVKEGDEIDVAIDDIGSRGDGVARLGGFLIFVPDSKAG